jgi:proteasome beta subunit
MNEINMEKHTLHGTTTVGIACKDGVVIAADKRATAGHLVVNKKTMKLEQVAESMVLSMAGTVSDAQLLIKLIKAELNLKKIRTGRQPTVKEAANLLSGMVYGNIRRPSMIPGIAHFILAGADTTGCYVYDIFPDGSLTLEDEYVTSGSGSVFALGVLETLYKKGMSTEEGVQLAVTAINAALKRDSASGNGIDVMVITQAGVQDAVHEAVTYDVKINK